MAAKFFRYGSNREHGLNIDMIVRVHKLHTHAYEVFMLDRTVIILSLKELVKLRQKLEAEDRVI